jgi:hypothetical protein
LAIDAPRTRSLKTREGIEETLKHGLEYLLHRCGATVRQDGAADENARATGSEVDRCTVRSFVGLNVPHPFGV